MRILHVAPAPSGGAGRSAAKVHLGLRALGIDSRALIAQSDPAIEGSASLWPLGIRILDRTAARLQRTMSVEDLVYPSSSALLAHPWYRYAAVVQLYNTRSILAYPVVRTMARSKHVVWRLSDMWPMTGGCAYSYGCERWLTGCGECPQWSPPAAIRSGEGVELPRDTTSRLWRRKLEAYGDGRVTIVAPSRWMASLAARSPVVRASAVHIIPNGVDVERYRPQEREEARAKLGIRTRKRVVLISAHNLTSPRKGAHVAREALRKLDADVARSIFLLVVGDGAHEWRAELDMDGVAFGRTEDDERLATIYAASDVFVLPTLAENLPNAALESMACGTPVVSFDVGGVAEAIRPGQTGWLARTPDAEGLAVALASALADEDTLRACGMGARNVVLAEYTLRRQAQDFARLYRDLIGGEP